MKGWHRVTLSLCLIAGAASPCACRDDTPQAEEHPADQAYSCRGVIRGLPSPASPLLVLHHESIPTFVRSDGATVGLKAQAMSLAVAPAVSLKGLSEGTRVEFLFEVRWSSQPHLLLTGIAALPPGTRLEFDPQGEP